MKASLIILTTALSISMLATAHDPKEHAKESQPPDCQLLASMDHGNMDMDDPVMQAMMQKCKEVAVDQGDGHSEGNRHMEMKDTPMMKDDHHDDDDNEPGDHEDEHGEHGDHVDKHEDDHG